LNIEYMFVGSKKQLIDLYEDLDIIIGTRMHSMIVAISQDIPVIGISWQPKVSEIFKIIDNENSVFDIKTFGEKTDEIIAILNKQLAIVEKSNFGFAQEIIEEKTQIDFRLLNKVAEELNNE
ncbi:polysaccharide pyruvyl transferase family protein, partial [Enterococcus faecium]|nr:polysaccharide pyruvyl transferase family protein [Enterococcus faecium]